jgi:hypothetical protein
MTIKISEDNKFVYYKTADGVVHGEPLTKKNKDRWIYLASLQDWNHEVPDLMLGF